MFSFSQLRSQLEASAAAEKILRCQLESQQRDIAQLKAENAALKAQRAIQVFLRSYLLSQLTVLLLLLIVGGQEAKAKKQLLADDPTMISADQEERLPRFVSPISSPPPPAAASSSALPFTLNFNIQNTGSVSQQEGAGAAELKDSTGIADMQERTPPSPP